MGIFTKNAKINSITIFELYINMNVIMNEVLWFIKRILASNGSEAVTVYISK